MASTSCFLHHLHALTNPARSPSQLRHAPTQLQLMKPNPIVCRAQKQALHEDDTAGSAVSRRLALTVLIGAAAVGSKDSPADAAYGEAANVFGKPKTNTDFLPYDGKGVKVVFVSKNLTGVLHLLAWVPF